MSAKNKGDGRRVARVEKEVQSVIANYLISGIRAQLPGLVTVSKVMMPSDLKSARVYVSVILPTDLEPKQEEIVEEMIELLNRNTSNVQARISSELELRYCPRVSFYYDDTTQSILKVEKILAEIGKQQSEKSPTQNSDED